MTYNRSMELTHGIAYIWFFLLLILPCERCDAAVENLPQGSTSFRQAFTPNSTKKASWVWRRRGRVGSYGICKNQQSWLVTEKLNTTNIKEVLVEVEFTINSKSNKSLILVAVITGNAKSVFNITGKKLDSSGRLKATRLLQLNSRQTQFGIQASDKENCFIVYNAKLTYNYCPEMTIGSLAHFPRTISPGSGSLPVKVEGTCSGGRIQKKPHAYCARNGNWSQNKTIPCDCQPGQIKTPSGCIKLLPYAIQEIKVIRLSKRQAVLSWRAQEDIQYDIECQKCAQGQCNFPCSELVVSTLQNNTRDRQRRITVSHLEQGKGYIFTVCAKIKVVGLNDSVDVKAWNGSVMLRELPGKVRKISYTPKESNELVLSWQPPISWSLTNVSYKVTCKVYCIKPNCPQRCTKLEFIPSFDNLQQTNVTVKGFGDDAERYLFTIFTKDRSHDFSEDIGQVEWNFNAINYTVEIRKNITSDSKEFNVVDVIIGVSVLVLAVIITIVVTSCYNRWKARKHGMNVDDEPMENLYNCEVPLNTISGVHYVDPSNYESVKNLMNKNTMKLNEKYLKTEEMIGEGEFGVVCKGYLDIPGKEQVIVAVKTLRSGLSTKLRRDFLTEASVMGQFKDPNVIALHGVVLKKSIVKIVMEFMSNGSLDKYLLNNNNRLTTLQLLGMARGIASGMKYLSGRNFIHRDLAARNILVDSNLCCKVSDFGLTREICATSNYETRGGKIPVRWTAPEVIKHKKSFISSDVWSFGVVVWEIMSFGQRPYWDWDNFRVLQEIESGYRLPAPLKCPKSVHSLMLDCWEKDRTERPLFSYIVDNLDEWIRSPETVDQSPTLAKKKDEVVDVDSQSPIQMWLNSIKMGKYASNFCEAGYNNLIELANLTDENLLAIGIKLVGHRHKIHQSIPLIANNHSEKCE